MHSPPRALVPVAILLTVAACGSVGPEPALPGFENLSRNDSAARVDRLSPQGPTAPPPRPTESERAGATPQPGLELDPTALHIGKIIHECDTHLRAWSGLMGQPRSVANQDDIRALSYALGVVVARNRVVLEEQSISGPPRNRGIATAALGFSGDPTVLPLLMSNAADADPEIAAKALLATGVLASRETPIAPLHNAVMRPDASEAMLQNAAFALFQIAEKTRSDPDGSMESAFIALLRSPDALVRAQCALGLGLVRATSAVPQITDLLAADALPAVRTAAAWSLGLIGMRGSTAPLMRALEDPDEVTAGTARGALTRIHGRDYGPTAASWKLVEGP